MKIYSLFLSYNAYTDNSVRGAYSKVEDAIKAANDLHEDLKWDIEEELDVYIDTDLHLYQIVNATHKDT